MRHPKEAAPVVIERPQHLAEVETELAAIEAHVRKWMGTRSIVVSEKINRIRELLR